MDERSLPVFVLACVACGKTVSGKEDKCPRCGASFDSMEFECPLCGEKVLVSQTKCHFCETEFEIFAGEVAEASSVELDSSESGPSPQMGSDDKKAESVEYECPSCGKPVGESDSKCPHCGAMFSE
jgi:DNA-directed RNA polymerase subunit RPC12/RpoP